MPDIEGAVAICQKLQSRIAILEEQRQFGLSILRRMMEEENTTTFEGEDGYLVKLTPYAVRITPRKAREKQNPLFKVGNETAEKADSSARARK